MIFCEICGSTSGKIYGKSGKYGMNLCKKHYCQMRNHGKITSTTARSVCDKNEIVHYDDYAEVILYDIKCNKVARAEIDLDDVETVSKRKWCIDDKGYVMTRGNIKLHRLLTGSVKGMAVDHIDHNKLNNRKSNLRLCTIAQNNTNVSIRSTNTSGTTGVCWSKNHNKWKAAIQINGKSIHIGLFVNIDDAIEARNNAEIKYFGEFRFLV